MTFIQLDAAALNNNILQIPLPNGTTLTLINTLRETPFPGVNTWAGEGRDGFSYGTFASNQETGNVTGRFSVGRQNYRIDSYGNKAHVLVDVDTSRLPPAHEPASIPDQKKSLTPPNRAPLAGETAKALEINPTPITIDLLIAYTRNAKSALGNPVDAVAEAMVNLNQSLSRIGLANVRARVVSFYETSLNDTRSSTKTMVRVFSASEEMRSRQKSSGADLMILLTGEPLSVCGEVLDFGPNRSTAYAAVNAICMNTKPALQHEFAHLFGARHEIAKDSDGLSYAHGFVNVTLGTCMKTIVVSGDPDVQCGRDFFQSNVFSNPRHGVAVPGQTVSFGAGDARADNARVIAEAAPMVANFSAGGDLPPSPATKAKRATMLATVAATID